MKFFRSFLIMLVVLASVIAVNGMVQAQRTAPNPVSALEQLQPKGTANFEPVGTEGATQLPAAQAIWIKVWRVVRALIMAAGVVAIYALISTGFAYAMSFGVPEKLEAAKKSFFWALGGLVVVLLAYFLVNTIIGILLFIGEPGEAMEAAAGTAGGGP